MRLARTLPAQLLSIHAPHAPDRSVCSPSYGTGIEAFDCQFIVDAHWPSGKTPVHYYFSPPTPANAIGLPVISNSIGWDSSCQVAIEPAGPNHRYPPYVAYSPDMMRGLAAYVIQKCAIEDGGVGGFVTVGLEAAERYMEAWVDTRDEKGGENKSVNDSGPPSGAYLTISINGKNRTRFAPGDTDPDIAGYLARYAGLSSALYNEKLTQWQALARFLRDRAIIMIRGAPGGTARVWWDGAGLSIYTAQVLQQFGANGSNGNSQESQPDSGHSDWTNIGGPGKHFGADGKGQPEAGAGNGDSESNGVGGAEDGEMAYVCDTTSSSSMVPVSKGDTAPSVGPDPIDCEKLSWSGLPGSRDPTSLLTLENPPSPSSSSLSSNSSSGIGKPLLFTHGTCTLAVFATSPQLSPSSPAATPSTSTIPTPLPSGPANGNTTISWSHILAAFETLTNLCVANPLYPKKSRGGEAYWSRQGQAVGSWIHGRKKYRRSRRGSRGVGEREDFDGRSERQEDWVDGWKRGVARSNGEEILGEPSLGRRDGVDGVDGAMALPRGVNVTVFRTGSGTLPSALQGAGV